MIQGRAGRRIVRWSCWATLMFAGRAAGAASPPPLQFGDLPSRSTAALAAALLPPSVASGMIRHEIEPAFVPTSTPPGIRFFAAGRKVGRHLCRKEATYVSFPGHFNTDPAVLAQLPVEVSQTFAATQIAWSQHCDDPALAYAYINAPARFEDAARVLATFARWQSAAGRAVLSEANTAITCSADYPTDACAGPPALVLTRIRLNQIFLISQLGDQESGWHLSTLIDHDRIWMIRIVGDPAHPTQIDLHWGTPPPF